MTIYLSATGAAVLPIQIPLIGQNQQTTTYDVNVVQISGDTTAADNAEAFFDGTGYTGANNVIGTVTTVVNLTNAATNGDLTATMKASVGDVVWDEQISGHLTAGSTGAVLNALTTAVADVPTVQEIVDGVWDELIINHLDVGSTGEALNAAGSAGDPWTTALPKALLVKAGYGAPHKKLTVTLLSASRSNVAQQELAMVAADLAAVGVELRIQYQTDWPTFEASLSQETLQMYRYAWFADIPDADNFLNILCGSKSRYNFMRYSNPAVDRHLSQALAETDMLKRVKLYREAERIILSDAPMVPLMYLTFESAFQSYVKGLEISSLGQPYIPLKKIWLDHH